LSLVSFVQIKIPNNIKNVIIELTCSITANYSKGQTTDPKFTAALINLIGTWMLPNINFQELNQTLQQLNMMYE